MSTVYGRSQVIALSVLPRIERILLSFDMVLWGKDSKEQSTLTSKLQQSTLLRRASYAIASSQVLYRQSSLEDAALAQGDQPLIRPL